MQIGLGKSFEAGILKAGFSLTVFGIIEGVIARWLPYGQATPEGNKNELQDGYYFALTGTMGVQGRLYGSISFAIISADLNVAILIYVRITFVSYEPIPITAKASVDVTLTVMIDLGLFKISIHLGFKTQVEATFVLDNPMHGPAPWAIENKAAGRGHVRTGAAHRARPAKGCLARAVRSHGDVGRGKRLQPKVGQLETGHDSRAARLGGSGPDGGGRRGQESERAEDLLRGQFLAQGREADPGRGTWRDPCPEHGTGRRPGGSQDRRGPRSPGACAVAARSADGAKFEDLAIRVLQWVIAAGQELPLTPQDVDQLVISDDFLTNALLYLSGSTTPTPIAGVAIESFLNLQTKFLFSLKTDVRKNAQGKDEAVPVVFFPAAPGMTLDVPAFAGSEEYKYAFGGYNSSSTGYLAALNKYFNQLKIQVQEEQKKETLAAPDAEADGPSIATYIFGDYFAMIGRLMIQAMRDGLRNYKLVISDYAGKTVQQVVDDINTKGKLDATSLYTVGELFVANQGHALNTTAGPAMTIAGMKWQSAGGKSFADIAGEAVFNGGFDATALALQNAANATILAPGTKIADKTSYTTQSGDSLQKIASQLEFADVKHLLLGVPSILSDAKLLAPQSILDVPRLGHKVVAGDTLQTVSGQYGIDLDTLASVNAGVKDLFDSVSDPNLNVPHLSQYPAGADRGDEAYPRPAAPERHGLALLPTRAAPADKLWRRETHAECEWPVCPEGRSVSGTTRPVRPHWSGVSAAHEHPRSIETEA